MTSRPTIEAEVLAQLAAAAHQRRDALTAVGFPTSALWAALEAPVCDACAEYHQPRALRLYKRRYLCPDCIAAAEELEAERYAEEHQPVRGCDPYGPLDGAEPV